MKKTLAFLTLMASLIVLPASLILADDAAPAAPTTPTAPAGRRPTVNHRLRNQRRRIRAGVRSGKLSPTEAEALKSRDRQVRTQEKEMRKQNGGKLSPEDKAQLNKELNDNSKDIYQEKHD